MAMCEAKEEAKEEEEAEREKEKEKENENEQRQLLLYCGLEELLFFLKKGPMNVSFACDAVRDIIKLGVGTQRPHVDSYIMPMASSCLPMLLAFLGEGSLPTLEDHLLCADAAVSLLGMFPPDRAATVISHCYQQLGDEANSVVDLSLGETKLFLKMKVSKPQGLKLCLARALLRNQHCLTRSVMMYLTGPIATACYQYSPLTCLAFRTLHMWLSSWKKMDLFLDAKDCQNIYAIVVDNWENQVPGVRKEISKVLIGLLDVACPSSEFTVENVIQHVIDDLSWKMKSKYFLLAMLIPRYGVTKALEKFPNIVSSLVASLGATRLISAGADVYRVCLASFQDVDSWCRFFHDPVLSLLTSQDEHLRLSQLNLLSRWLSPTLKKFPVLTEILHTELSSLRSTNSEVDLPLSALVHVGRKEGYIQDIWPKYSFIELYLTHSNEEVRKHAFGAVCKKTKKTVVPDSEEFEAVKKFLIENVNVDSCTLRQSLVDSFSHFLERLLISSRKLTLGQGNINTHFKLMAAFTFLKWLHKFILENLKFGGNYQRKVTSLQLYLEVMRWFGPGAVKSSEDAECVREQLKQLDMWSFESEESWVVLVDCVLSPTEDIQKVAADILANHLKLLDDEGALPRMEKLWNLTLSQCSSAVFYEAESGCILMKLIVPFLLESPHLSQIIPPPPNVVRYGQCVDVLLEAFHDLTSSFETALRPLLAYWHKELARQWMWCQEELLAAVTSGCGLHGVLAAFSHLVPFFSQGDVARLLLYLERIVDHFLDVLSGQAANTTVSASFAEMTQAIERMVAEGEGEEGESYSTQLSPAHQLVLSCVWLTLKQSCLLAQVLFCHWETSGMDAVRCLEIVEKVLLRCRYKGTIEAAGAALGVMVRQATSKEENRRCLPSFILECGEKLSDFLQDMLLKVLRGVTVYSNKTSVTRRSAGVGILVQKIVACDSRPDKPLLQVCLRRLFETVETSPPAEHALAECDLPQACALHLLGRLVQEALLRQEMLPLASAIALLCFQTFSSPTWTVQNAALQLFGVLVPLLVGEKKVHDDDMETYGNLTTEEFFSHHPSLAAFFIEEIQKSTSDQSEARNIIPILSFLSKLTFGDSWSIDNCSSEMQEMQKLLQLLLDNCEVTVRRLAAKCYSRFLPKNLVYQSTITFLNELEQDVKLSENKIHGYLLTLHLLVYRLVDDGADIETFSLVHKNFQKVNLSKASWISKSIFMEVSKLLVKHTAKENSCESLQLVRKVVDALNKYSASGGEPAGIFLWAVQCIEFVSIACNDDEICSVWNILYENNFFELSNSFIQGIQKRISELSSSVKEQITNTLLGNILKDRAKYWNLLCSIYTILLEIIPSITMTLDIETISTVFIISRKEENIHCWSVALPFSCELFAPHIKNFPALSQRDLDLLKTLSEETRKRSSAEECDVKERVHGAKAFVTLFRELSHLHSQNAEVKEVPVYVDVVSLLLDSGIAFLQDEDCSVRKEACKFVVPEQNPYGCLTFLLSISGLQSVFSNFHIARYFQGKLLDFSTTEAFLIRSENKNESVVSTSVFDYGTSNIYEEEAQVVCAMADSFMQLLMPKPSWQKDLPAPPNIKDLEGLVTRMLEVRKAKAYAGNGAAVSKSDLYVLLTRLKVAERVSECVPGDSSTEDYKKLVEYVTSTLE